ncbi:MAG TPA: hypothetical protein PK360_16500 [bacterium]|nr:hypothetical protein [bacterium]
MRKHRTGPVSFHPALEDQACEKAAQDWGVPPEGKRMLDPTFPCRWSLRRSRPLVFPGPVSPGHPERETDSAGRWGREREF